MFPIQLLVVLMVSSLCSCQEGTYEVVKTAARRQGTLIRAKCTYTMNAAPATKVEFGIGFDGKTRRFKSTKVSVIDKVGNMYHVRSVSDVTKKVFVVTFTVLYSGSTVPQGSCSQLITLEGTTTPITIPMSLAYTFPATIVKSWSDNGGTRIEAMCVFKVEKTTEPKQNHFIIDFGTNIQRYEDWVGDRIEPEGETGHWFHMKNLHWLHPSSLVYSFHATYYEAEAPIIICNSDLPEYIETTQAPVTTSQAPLTSTKTLVTTTKEPETSSKGPVTTTQAPVTTSKATGTTNGPSSDFLYTFPATVKSSWQENGGIRTDALCVFAVDKTYEPNTLNFLINFGVPVTNYMNWKGTLIQPKTNAGTSFFMTNTYWVHKDKLEMKFQATYSSSDSPVIMCSGDLPQFGETTQKPVTTTKAPTTTTSGTDTSTKSPGTTTMSPGTTTEPPGTTTKPPGTTNETLKTSTKTSSTTTEQRTTRATTQPPVGSYNYNEVIKKSIWFYRAQRSGDLPEVVNDPVPWRGDSALYDGSDVGVDLTGGWYDAGDWVKFNLPISSAVAILSWGVVQWKDAYVAAGQYNEMLDCIKWPLDYFLKCWRENDQILYGQVGNGGIDHSKMMRPEDMTEQNMHRPSYFVTSTGSDLSGTMVVAFAAGSIAFKETNPSYSATLLSAAKSLYTFADKNRGLYTQQIPDASMYYSSSDYKDELVYAAVMLYKATGDSNYLEDAESKYSQFGMNYKVSWAFDWDDKLMAAKLLLYEATGDSRYSNDVKTFLSNWRPGNSVTYTPGGFAWRLQWGSLRYTANAAFLALMAADLGIDVADNVAWAKGQIDYMLGDNPRSSSYVVGFGNNPPRQPHHKASTCQPKPAPCDWGVYGDTSKDNAHILYGALVGGPDASDNYVDDRTDYVMAEVTCDYNAGFQSAVAGILHFKNN